MKINIVFDNIIYSLQKFGGISVYWSELLVRFQKNNLFNPSFIEYSDAMLNISRKAISLQVQNVIPRDFTFILRRYLKAPNTSNYTGIFHSSYYRISSQSGLLNVVTVHDFIYEKFMKKIKSFPHLIQKYYALRKADGIICISENTKKDLLHYYPKLKNKPIKVIYNGFSNEIYKHNSEMIYMPKSYVLFVGGRNNYKNFNLAVYSIVNLHHINLYIVGSKLNEAETTFLNKLIPNRFKVFTNINSSNLNELYQGALALLYLSKYEGFGIPVLEAMGSGCPVIALNRSSIPEVADNAGILIDKEDPSLIYEMLVKLQSNQEYRNTIIHKGLSRVKDFSWDKSYKLHADFYLELLNNFNRKKSGKRIKDE